jgi:hypothetical protein
MADRLFARVPGNLETLKFDMRLVDRSQRDRANL